MDIASKSDPLIRRTVAKTAAIIPVGSLEQHGAHLPVSTDSDIVTEVAIRTGKGRNFLVLPTVTMGVSFEHSPLFNLSIRPTTLTCMLKDICKSLHDNGINNIFVINGHYGNRKALAKLAQACPEVHIMSYWRFTKHKFDHAGLVETSLMLAISDHVHMSMAHRGLVTDNMSDNELRTAKRKASTSFPEATGNGIWGDPRKSTPALGRKILSEIVSRLRAECVGRIRGDLPNEILI